eukprot:EG_transcript_10030
MQVYARLQDLAPAVGPNSPVLVHGRHPGRVRFVAPAAEGAWAGVEVPANAGLGALFDVVYYVSGGFAGVAVRLSELSLPNPMGLARRTFPPPRTASGERAPLSCPGVGDVPGARLLALEALAGLDQQLVDRLALRGSAEAGLGLTTLMWGACLLAGVADVARAVQGRLAVVPLLLAADPVALSRDVLRFSKFHSFLTLNRLLPSHEPFGTPATETPQSFLLGWLQRHHQYALLLRPATGAPDPWPGPALRSTPQPGISLPAHIAPKPLLPPEMMPRPSTFELTHLSPNEVFLHEVSGSTMGSIPSLSSLPLSADSLSATALSASPGSVHSWEWRRPPRGPREADHYVDLRPPTPVSDVVVFRYHPQLLLGPHQHIGNPTPGPRQRRAVPAVSPYGSPPPRLSLPAPGPRPTPGPAPRRRATVGPTLPRLSETATHSAAHKTHAAPPQRFAAATAARRGPTGPPLPTSASLQAAGKAPAMAAPDVFRRLYNDALRQHRLREVLGRREQER